MQHCYCACYPLSPVPVKLLAWSCFCTLRGSAVRWPRVWWLVNGCSLQVCCSRWPLCCAHPSCTCMSCYYDPCPLDDTRGSGIRRPCCVPLCNVCWCNMLGYWCWELCSLCRLPSLSVGPALQFISLCPLRALIPCCCFYVGHHVFQLLCVGGRNKVDILAQFVTHVSQSACAVVRVL